MKCTAKTLTLGAVVLIAALHLSFFPFGRKFPSFSYQDQYGNQITEARLQGKKSIVMLFHLGCPAAMNALIDLNRLQEELDVAQGSLKELFGVMQQETSLLLQTSLLLHVSFCSCRRES